MLEYHGCEYQNIDISFFSENLNGGAVETILKKEANEA